MGLTLKRTHAELVRQVLRACNLMPGVFLFPVDVTVARRGRIIRRLGMTGTPDILGWSGGWCGSGCARMIAFEVKVGRDRLRPEQAAFLEKLRRAGGIALEIRSVEQAVTALS
jgi:hypothetical protein